MFRLQLQEADILTDMDTVLFDVSAKLMEHRELLRSRCVGRILNTRDTKGRVKYVASDHIALDSDGTEKRVSLTQGRARLLTSDPTARITEARSEERPPSMYAGSGRTPASSPPAASSPQTSRAKSPGKRAHAATTVTAASATTATTTAR